RSRQRLTGDTEGDREGAQAGAVPVGVVGLLGGAPDRAGVGEGGEVRLAVVVAVGGGEIREGVLDVGEGHEDSPRGGGVGGGARPRRGGGRAVYSGVKA